MIKNDHKTMNLCQIKAIAENMAEGVSYYVSHDTKSVHSCKKYKLHKLIMHIKLYWLIEY